MKIIRKNAWHSYTECSGKAMKWSFWNDIIPYGEEAICFNTRSGAIVVFDKEEYRQYKE